MKPTSPGPSRSICSALGVNTPTLSICVTAPVPMKRIFWPFASAPSFTRTSVTTPR